MRTTTRRTALAAALAGALLPALATVPAAGGASAATAGTAKTAGTVKTSTTARSAAVANPMLFGVAAAGRAEVEQHERDLGRKLAGVHYYRKWDSVLFGADQTWMRDTGRTLFLAVRSERRDGKVVLWRDIAAAQPGSALHADMVRQGKEIAAFGAKVYVTFNHEPEAAEAAHMGSPAEFVAAWRKVVTTWREAGATNAELVLNTTAWGFARKDAKNVKYYYPGDEYVDHIASDAYNWYGCRTGQGWRPLAAALEAQRRFGLEHPDKSLMVLEFGSGEDAAVPGRKGQWLTEASALFQLPGWEQFSTLVYWPGRNFTGESEVPGCMDYTTSTTALAGARALATAPQNMSTTVVR